VAFNQQTDADLSGKVGSNPGRESPYTWIVIPLGILTPRIWFITAASLERFED
jgi:hypothetical protein